MRCNAGMGPSHLGNSPQRKEIGRTWFELQPTGTSADTISVLQGSVWTWPHSTRRNATSAPTPFGILSSTGVKLGQDFRNQKSGASDASSSKNSQIVMLKYIKGCFVTRL